MKRIYERADMTPHRRSRSSVCSANCENCGKKLPVKGGRIDANKIDKDIEEAGYLCARCYKIHGK